MLNEKDTETSVGNIGTLYEGEGKLGPKQHLSHPIQPKHFANSKHHNEKLEYSNLQEQIFKINNYRKGKNA